MCQPFMNAEDIWLLMALSWLQARPVANSMAWGVQLWCMGKVMRVAYYAQNGVFNCSTQAQSME